MSRSITIEGVERADLTRLESFSFQESAYRGEAGSGGFDVDSESGAINVRAWKNVVAIDSDGGQFYTGQTVDRGLGRGPFKGDSDARWDVQTIDINTIMDDVLLRGSDCNRPDETDVERMQWLFETELPSHGITIGTDYLLTADPEDMDAQDYRKQGVYPRSVADECAENSGKNWYLFYDVGVTDQLQVWYGAEAATERTCDYGISSVLDDIDDYGVVWAAEWPEESGLQLDPSRVYSAVQVVYNDPPVQVFVNRPATEGAFKRRQAVLFDASVHKETTAIKLGEHYLDAAETEDLTITVAVTVPTTHVNAFQHGQRIPFKAPHLGYDDPTYMRCRTRTIEPAGSEGKAPGLYRVTLVLKPSVKVTRFGGRPSHDVPGQGDNPSPTPPGIPTEPTTDCGTGLAFYHLKRQNNGQGTYTETLVAIGVGTPKVASAVYFNAPYTDPSYSCFIGGGSWLGFYDQEVWIEYTAPADDPTAYLGLTFTLDCSILGATGYAPGYTIRAATGAAAATRYGQGTVVAPGPLTGTITVTVPRSAIDWGATNCIVLHPEWLCERNTRFCNPTGYFGNPESDGRANSGAIAAWGFTGFTICAVQLTPGSEGMAIDVPGVGDVDGANITFSLLGWNGTSPVSAEVNGLDTPDGELTLDPGAGTVSFVSAPPATAVVLFTYPAST